MKILSKALVISLFLISSFFLLPSAHAISPSSQSDKTAPTSSASAAVPNNLHNWTQTVMIEVMSSLTCQLAGVDPIKPNQPCLGNDQEEGKIGFLPSPQTGGAIGFMGNMISVLYTPPLHTGDYFRNLASNFGISKPALAQNTGAGFQSLTPLIGVWSAFRNIVYLILVIVFVVIGLAIMLRVKIDPRTVMTIQNQIPKIIMGILAVTFSFAIAGFLVDMMWMLIYLTYGIFSGIPGVNIENLNPSSIQGQTAFGASNHIRTAGVFGIANNVAMSTRGIITDFLGISVIPGATFANIFEVISGLKFQPTGELLPNFLIDGLSAAAGLLTGSHWAQLIGDKSIFGWSIPTGTVAGITAGFSTFLLTEAFLRFIIPYGIVFLIILVALISALFRLWLALIMAYVQILLGVVLAPFWIIGGIIPGSPISLGGWVKNMAANLLAFPVTIAMFMLGKVFMDTFGSTTTQNAQKFVPPLIGNPGDPSIIGSLIGLGIILMTPNVVNLLKQMLKAPKTDTGIGKSISGATGVITGTGKSSMGAASAFLMGDPLTGKKGGEGLRTALTRKFFG